MRFSQFYFWHFSKNVVRHKMHVSFTLPAEIWEKILDLLDTNSLLSFQHTCHQWRNIILEYVMRGRLRNRALVSN